MKNILLFMAIFIVVVPVYAEGDTAINLNLGDFGIGMMAPFNDTYGLELMITALNIGVENRPTGLGMEFSPFKYVSWTGRNERQIDGISLVNLKLYWDMLAHEFSDTSIYFGPFASANYMFVGEYMQWNRYVFTGGAQFGLRAAFGKVNYNILSFEMGYRNITGTGKYFFGFKVDAIIFLALIAILKTDSDD